MKREITASLKLQAVLECFDFYDHKTGRNGREHRELDGRDCQGEYVQ
jgi:hypothetical protein